ncbi:hypothetical protein [Streptomyces yangpuensis]|uniref:hypothetical protein n=1 Tax=Streptomyces yangpuensis TaxID=1648182 RepID=UPI0037176613
MRADKAYASRKNRAYLRSRGIRCIIPNKADQARNRQKLGSRGGRPPRFERVDYRERHAVECGINRLETAGLSPVERWDEAGGTAFYSPKGDPALAHGPWVNGIVVFWGTRGARRGWGYAPLDAAGNPLLETAAWLPVAPSVAPALLTGHLRHLFAEGAAAPELER